jgi:hypothetical protein
MNMRTTINILLMALILGTFSLLSGCGSSGGGSNQPDTIVKGTASKGIIYPGTVSFYAVNAAGVRETVPIGSVPTDVNGRYQANLGQYAGMLVLEVSGSYTDEATGTVVTIPADAPLHAVIDQVDGATFNNRTVAITPLTELAYQLSGTPLSAAAVTAANRQVGELFKVPDIIGTEPVRPDPAVMGSAGVSSSQQAYTMALMTLSQMAENSAGGAPASASQVSQLLASFKSDLTSSDGLGESNRVAFANALAITSTSPEMAGFEKAASFLASVGNPIFKLTLTAANVPQGVTLGSLKTTITLPPGVTIRSDANGQTLTGLIEPAGAVVSGNTLVTGNYQAGARQLVISLVSTTGFSAGDVAEITFDMAPGSSVTAANFTAVINEAKDAGPAYGSVAGVNLSLR